MLRIDKKRTTVATTDGTTAVVADLQASTKAELPGTTDTVEGCTILPGSRAQIIRTGDICTMDGDGTWYDQDGNEAG